MIICWIKFLVFLINTIHLVWRSEHLNTTTIYFLGSFREFFWNCRFGTHVLPFPVFLSFWISFGNICTHSGVRYGVCVGTLARSRSVSIRTPGQQKNTWYSTENSLNHENVCVTHTVYLLINIINIYLYKLIGEYICTIFSKI